MGKTRFFARWSAALVLLLGSSGGSSGVAQEGGQTPSPGREFRAVAGVSMGAYGAMNLGTKRPDLFGTVASLGGPVDLGELLARLQRDLEVRTSTGAGAPAGAEVTFDLMPPYPSRDTRIRMFQDLVLAFGNPFLHHPDPSRLYLASDSEPAALGWDDRFGAFPPPADSRSFFDGGDANGDGVRQLGEIPDLAVDVLLAAAGSLASSFGIAGSAIGGRALADADGDGVYDVGDGLVLNGSEPFDDRNGNLAFDPETETFEDFGLDGVAGTGDFGEGNGQFDVDPDRSGWLLEDPLSRLAGRTAAEIASQRIYMDVGTGDEFGFARHYENFVSMLAAKGLSPAVRDGFSGSCLSVPSPREPFLLIRYEGGHLGIPTDDPIRQDLLGGDVCGAAVIWHRLLTLIGYLNGSFPDGFFGPGGLRLRGSMITRSIPSPALALPGQAAPLREVVVYRPAAFANTNRSFPIVYFLGGYGQEPADYRRLGSLLDALMSAGLVQNMVFAFVPGAGGHRGSFYVNHRVPEAQVPGFPDPTTGRYEDSLLEDLIPEIENTLLGGRVRSD
jgi:hypothetical protein